MCSKCSLPNLSVNHKESTCPYIASIYCSYCAVYGHLYKDCSVKPVNSKPMYLEQLIPQHLCKKYNIKTRTPLETTK